MKGEVPGRGAPQRAKARYAEVREHWLLLVAWAFVLLCPIGLIPASELFDPLSASPATLASWDSWRVSILYLGGIALCLLVLRLVIAGYTGYERRVGLRIIGGNHSGPRARRWLWICAGSVCVGILVLLAFQHLLGDAAFDSESPWKGVVAVLRLLCVAVVAIGSFFGLLLAIGQRFSVFGTTSIFGIVLGVAALLVVQSVATGFQHEFERRVLGVYAHINVTRSYGISEYRRFEQYLQTLDGVEGGSPFVYYAMALAPYDPDGQREGDIRLGSPRARERTRDSPLGASQ
jgi:lipoprotein-releasing system permease protein